MNPTKKHVGDRFHSLVVIEHAGVNNVGHCMFLCKCDCGKMLEVSGANLRSGNSKSCGCVRSNNVLITHEDITMTLTQWANHLKIPKSTLHRRLRTMSIKRAFSSKRVANCQ